MKYIVTIKAKRKNAKRHILDNGFKRAFDTFEEAEKRAILAKSKNYTIEIYTSKWEFVKAVD